MTTTTETSPAPDLLSEIMRSVRLEGSVFFRSLLSAPWGIDLPAANEPRFHIVLEGSAWLHSERMPEPREILAGSALLLRDGENHWIADSPQSPRVPSEVAGEAYAAGRPLFQGGRTDCHMLCGRFGFDRAIGHPLFETLPELAIVENQHGPGFDWLRRSGALMDEEIVHNRLGSSVAIDRVCEVFLIQLLRYLIDDPEQISGFVAALDDKPVNRALSCIHQQPSEPWDLHKLAAAAGLSRSAFVNRFTSLVGMPPKAYLTMWRMQQARKLLRNPYKLLGQIASEVGYASDVALIRAFQRHFGKSPKEMRRELSTETD